MAIVEPKQERSRKTLESLLRTGVRLLSKGNPQDLRIEEVVSKAGSSIGSFYARFPSKTEYLEALAERLEGDLQDRLLEIIDGTAEPSGVEATAEALVAAFARESRQRSALRRADVALAKRGRKTDRRVMEHARAALERAGIADADRSRRATELLVATVDGAAQTFASEKDRTALLEALPGILVAYLDPTPPKPRRTPVDPFDVWA